MQWNVFPSPSEDMLTHDNDWKRAESRRFRACLDIWTVWTLMIRTFIISTNPGRKPISGLLWCRWTVRHVFLLLCPDWSVQTLHITFSHLDVQQATQQTKKAPWLPPRGYPWAPYVPACESSSSRLSTWSAARAFFLIPAEMLHNVKFIFKTKT